jgi:hypothetical protein
VLGRQDLDFQVQCRRLGNWRRPEISTEMAKLLASMGWGNYWLTLSYPLTKKPPSVYLRKQGPSLKEKEFPSVTCCLRRLIFFDS